MLLRPSSPASYSNLAHERSEHFRPKSNEMGKPEPSIPCDYGTIPLMIFIAVQC